MKHAKLQAKQAKLQAKVNLLVWLEARFFGGLQRVKSFITSKHAKLANYRDRKFFLRNFFAGSNLSILLVCLYLVVKRINKPP